MNYLSVAVDVEAVANFLASDFERRKMDYSTAQQLMSMYERMGTIINEADNVIRTLPDIERTENLRALAGLIEHLWSALQHPIVRQYKDLDPDRDYFSNQPSGQRSGE